jgi:hypothetical protein
MCANCFGEWCAQIDGSVRSASQAVSPRAVVNGALADVGQLA